MGESMIPPERLAFYNQFGRESVSSAIQAIDDAIEATFGVRASSGLLRGIRGDVEAAWRDFDKELGASFAADRPGSNIPAATLRPAAKICNLISDDFGVDVIDPLGLQVAVEIRQALSNLTEGAMNIYGDVLRKLRDDSV